MQIVSTDKAPQAIGPYSQAVEYNGMVFTSGQIALLPSGELAGDDIDTQTRQVLSNLSAVLEEAGSSLQKVLKTTIFLADMDDFAEVNRIYRLSQTGKKHRSGKNTAQKCKNRDRLYRYQVVLK